MVALIVIAISIALLAGFLGLTVREAKTGTRVLADRRDALDAKVMRIAFIVKHVDFESFLREQVRTLSARVVHDIAHFALLFVREVERFLTRAIKYLRVRHDIPAPNANTPRAFVQAMSDFKQQLAATRPVIPEFGKQL